MAVDPAPPIDDRWPFDAGVSYRPGTDVTLLERTDDMMAKGALAARAQGQAVYVDGACPRCGHLIGCVVPVQVVGPTKHPLTGVFATCNCSESHDRKDGTGCGLQFEVPYS